MTIDASSQSQTGNHPLECQERDMTGRTRTSEEPLDTVLPRAVLVTAPDCHFCGEAKELLGELVDAHRLELEEVDLSSQEGLRILSEVRAPFPPILLIDGTYIGHGRISKRRLMQVLDRAEQRGC